MNCLNIRFLCVFYRGQFICVRISYCPAIRSMGGILSLPCLFSLFCTLTDFSTRASPIGVKFCWVVWPDLGQVFSHSGGIARGMAEFWASTGGHVMGYASCWSTCLVYCLFPGCCCLVVSTSAIDCLERLVSEMTYYVSSGMFNPTHSFTNLGCCKMTKTYW